MKNNSDCRANHLCLLALGLATLAVPLPAQGQGPMNFASGRTSRTPGEFSNYVSLSLYQPSLDGNVAQYMQRHGAPGIAFGGIQGLHLERFVGATGFVTLDGRAIPSNNEYRLKLDYEVSDVGFVRIGVNNFRVRYDGSAGYFHPLETQFEPLKEELAVDRGEAWIEGGLKLAPFPHINFKYSRSTRHGAKPSLAWGDTRTLGSFGDRNISPSFWKTDEERTTIQADVRQKIGPTDLSVGMIYQTGDSENSLNIWRRPGESAERFLTDTAISDSETLDLRAGAVTRIRQNLLVTTNYRYQTLDNDIAGDRIYGLFFGLSFAEDYPGSQRRDRGFIDALGLTTRTLHSGSINLRFWTGSGLSVVPTFRIDRQETTGLLEVVNTNLDIEDGDRTMEFTPLLNSSSRDATDLSGSLELRYAGIPNFVVHVRGDWLERDANLFEQEIVSRTEVVSFSRETNNTRTAHKYLAGATFYPFRQLRIGVQAYTRSRTVEYDHILNADGPLSYPGFLRGQDYKTEDANIQVRWRAPGRLTLTSRYDLRRTTIEGTGGDLQTYESATIESSVFTNSLIWSPVPLAFLRATVVYSMNSIATPINQVESDVDDLVLKTKNDYISANIFAGVALLQWLDLEGQYFYYRADNFVDNSESSLPYGSGAEERGLSAGGTLLLGDALTASLRFYHFVNKDDTFGGTEDYDLNLLSLSLKYRF